MSFFFNALSNARQGGGTAALSARHHVVITKSNSDWDLPSRPLENNDRHARARASCRRRASKMNIVEIAVSIFPDLLRRGHNDNNADHHHHSPFLRNTEKEHI
jgi:hypothetical protein